MHRLFALLILYSLLQPAYADEIKDNCIPINEKNLITNGSFENIELDGNEFGVRFTKTDHIPGWEVSGGPKGQVIASYPHSGNNILLLASSEGYRLTQTVNTQPGKNYLLRFWSKYHREQHPKFDLKFTPYPAQACGTASDSILTAQGDWSEHNYILCPDTHSLTIEFSQLNYDTSGGFGIALDTVSLVPCTIGRPTSESLAFLHQTWVHAFEEDAVNNMVWRKAGSHAFPTTRFRRTLSFYQNGQCQFLSLEPNDAHQRKTCQWNFDPASNQLIIREASGQIAGNYQLNSLTQDLLTISK